jgi:hypothetical protein
MLPDSAEPSACHTRGSSRRTLRADRSVT